jgi:hypothetical protein
LIATMTRWYCVMSSGAAGLVKRLPIALHE